MSPFRRASQTERMLRLSRERDIENSVPAGKLARVWIGSKLTPLVIVGSVLLGLFSVWKLPREEEPQIIVPMVDVSVQMPGASAREVEERVTKPMEKLLWEIPGVEYIYSTSSPGMSMAIVRFLVGQDEEKSIVRLNQKLSANMDLIPPGASPPLVKPRSIDDVPILALTFWSKRYGDFELRRIAAQVDDSIKQTPDVSAVSLIGGAAPGDSHHFESSAPGGVSSFAFADHGRPRRFQSQAVFGRIRQRQPAISAGNGPIPDVRGRRAQRRGRRRQRQADLRARRRRSDRRRRRAVAICALLRRTRLLSGGDHRHIQTQGNQRRHRRRKCSAAPGAAARQRDSFRRPDDHHAQLRRHGQGEIERTAVAHADRRGFGERADRDHAWVFASR